MSKKVKVLVSVLVAVVLLSVGTALVMAQEEPVSTPEVEARGLIPRVAESLGVTDEELSNAFRQAQQEMREEAFIGFLDRARENERITQEEYDAIIAWWEQRPEALDSSLFPCAFGTSALQSRHMWGGHRGWCWSESPRLGN